MLDVAGLRAEMARRGHTIKSVSFELGITPKTFAEKMKRGVFRIDEVEKLIDILGISAPMEIFFADAVTCSVTEND